MALKDVSFCDEIVQNMACLRIASVQMQDSTGFLSGLLVVTTILDKPVVPRMVALPGNSERTPKVKEMVPLKSFPLA